MPEYNLEGEGVPVLTFADGTSVELPEPNGEGKGKWRSYNFRKETLGSYVSEGNVSIEIGKRFVFEATLSWISLSDEMLSYLFKAQNDEVVNVRLNKGRADINFDMKVTALPYSFFEGKTNHPAGYSVSLVLESVKRFTSAGYIGVSSGSGIGNNYGSEGSTPY